MKYAITATVHVSDLYKSLPKNIRPADAESQIRSLIKSEFERQGVRFMDKSGLFPVPPSHMRSEMVGAFPVITIKQGIS